MDEEKPEGIIIDKCSTEEDESEYVHNNKIKKDAKNVTEYEESLVINEVRSTATQKEEYYTDLLETVIENNDCSKTPLSK